MPTIDARLFGDFTIRIEEQTHTKFRTSKVQALLAYLIIEHKTPVRREQLFDLLWPGLPQQSAQVNMRQTLYQARKLLSDAGDAPILSERGMLQLNPELPLSADIIQFDTLLDANTQHDHVDLRSCQLCRERLEQVVTLYSGPLLANLYLADSNIFEEWANSRRVAYQRRYFDALSTLTSIYLRNGRYSDAEVCARRQLEQDNLREIAYQQLMEALARGGQREVALALYDECRVVLYKELGMSPAQRTTRLAERIGAGEIDLTPAQTPSVRGYELLERVGAGAFGDVHRAYQPLIEREVAIKIIKQEYANRPNFIRCFEVEARTIAQLEHPYIVPLYDYWRDPDGAFLIMRFMRGGNLETVLQEHGAWQPEAVLNLIDQLGSALATAHDRGVIHRDLKPANILLDESNNAYLSDFGIARHIVGTNGEQADGHQSDLLASSPYYTSPEQLRGDPATAYSDIYTFGFLLFELFTGRKPFEFTSMEQVLQQHLHGALPTVQSVNPALPATLDDVLQRATASDPADRFGGMRELADALRIALAGTVTRPVPMLIAQIEGNPYKGLRAFQETDAETFFGRSELTKQLTNHLTNTSFLAVVGPSGSGKSSVVKAGLLPALRAGAIDGSDEWFITEMIPGTHPLEELEAALLRIAVNPPSSLIEPLEKDDRGLVRTLKRILPITVDSHGQPPTLLLVIDQFEELFTLVDQQTRNLFLNNLLAALRDSRCRLRVVTTLRADFYDRPLQLPALADYIKADTVVVTPLTGVELEESIAGPAALAGTRLEDGLVARIIDDVHDQPGMLPLLQYALTELYERREDDSMTHAAYDALGGIQSVLGRRAEELYTGSTQVEQTLTRQLFLRLVTLGEGVEDTRRRVLQSELLSLGHSGQGEGRDAKTLTSLILQHFGEARLLSFDRDPITRTPTVEVAHEALLREWPRLRAWIEESRDDVRLQRLIAVSAAEWLAADKDAGFLLRGSRLDQFKGWAAATTVALAPDERIYLSTSSEARRLRVTEEEARRQRELETAQQLAEEQRQRAEIQSRSTKRLSYLVAGLIAILLVAIGAAWLAFVSQQQAQENFIESERIRLASQAQNAITRGESGELSMLLALNSLQNGYSPVADAALQTSIAQGLPEQIYVGHTDDIQHVQFSADGRKLLTASSDRTARIWDVQTGEELQRFVGHTATIISLDLSADNNHLLSSGADATVRLWNARTGEELFQFPGSPSAAGIDFTADGTQFLITVPGKVEFRSVATGEIVKQFSAVDGDGYDSEFSPNEAYILVTSLRGNSKARIWDATTGVPIIEFVGHEGWIGDSDFSPDNRYVFTVGQDGTARIWEVATGKELRRFEGHTDALFSGDYSPDGLTVLTGSYDKTVRLWDVMSGRELRQIRGHTDFAHGVFSPDGRYIATAGGDHVAKLWDISGNTEPAMRADFSADHFQDQTAISVSDDGQFVLVGRLSGVVDVISMSSGETVYELNTSLSQVNTQTLSPDGQLVVSGDSDGNVSLWNVVKGEPVWTFTGHDGPIRDVGFTKDGSQILTASEDGTARLIDRHSGMQTQQFSGHEDAVHSICATNSGDKVLTTSADGTVRLWDALSGAETRQFSGQSGATNNGVFSPDETMIAAGGTDRSTRLWQVDDGTLVQELIGHTGSILEVEFSANGQILLTGSEDQTARLWDIATGKEIHQYAGHISPIWEARFAPDGEHVFTADSRAVFEWLTTLDDLVALACDRLTRDLTEPERRFYNISGDKPTCEAHSEQLVVAEPTWTPIAAIPAPPPIAVEFMVMETANIQMGMPIQHVYVEDDEGMIIRPITLDENILDLPLFNSTETISDTLVPPFDVGPFPKGDPLGFTMREWISASGHGTYVLKDGRAQVDLEFHNLVPSGVYTLWCVKFNNDPFEILEEIACGLPDGSENNILVDEHGYGTISLEMDAFPLSTQDAVYELAVAYHSDGQTYGNHPGEYGKNLHAHMIFDFLPPDP